MPPPLRTGLRISHLLIDFDETLTTQDTISLLTAAAYSLRPPSSSSSSSGKIPPWDHFVNTYLHDYKHCEIPASSFPGTPLRKELASLSSVLSAERASIERIENAGLFRGVSLVKLGARAAETVPIREGFWRDLVEPAFAKNIVVSVVSVNWSRLWIREALKAASVREGGDKDAIQNKIKIYSNDLLEEGTTATASGKFDRFFSETDEGIWTAEHKLNIMQGILKADTSTDKGITVYFGDSRTDLLCLLAADFGIVIGEKLDSFCVKAGIKLVEVDYFKPGDGKHHGEKILIKVRSLKELGSCLELLV